MRKSRMGMLAVVLTMAAMAVAGPVQAATVADFQFGGGTLTDQSGNGYTATLTSPASLVTGGVSLLSGGYVTTNVPFSTVTGQSMTIEVITTCASLSGWGALAAAHNDYGFFFGKYNNVGQLQFSGPDTPTDFGTGDDTDFPTSGVLHRYVVTIDTSTSAAKLYVDSKTPVSNSTGGGTLVDSGTASNFMIGAANGGAANLLKGIVNRVRISTGVVSSANFIAQVGSSPTAAPSAPSGLSATTVSSGQINLAWTDNANNETGFKIERKTSSGGAYGQIATVGANVTTYNNTGLASATTYYYRVRAYSSYGDSAYCTEANATTQQAQGLIAITSPAYHANVSGNTTISISAPGIATITASCWQQGTGYGSRGNLTPTAVTLNASGVGSFVFPATSYPHGPTTIKIVGKNSSGAVVDTCYLQLFNTGGVTWQAGLSGVAQPSQASGMNLTYSDDFTSMPTISRFGEGGATYNSRPPRGDEYGLATFEDYDGAYNPFYVTETWMRIRTTYRPDFVDPKGWGRHHTTGFLASERRDGTGFISAPQTATYQECRMLYGAAHGTWPAFWSMSGNCNIWGAITKDELDTVEAYPHLRYWGYSCARHQWNYGSIHGGVQPNVTLIGGTGEPYEGFHTYGLLMGSSTSKMYFDNIEVWSFPTSDHYYAWNLGLSFMVNNAVQYDLAVYHRYGEISDLWVDWVRVYEGGGGVSTPTAPSALTATAVSSSQINLAWTDNASNETGFKIERKTGAGGTYAQIATVGANVTAYNNTGLSASTAYYYKIRATNSAGDSGYCTEASATTQAAGGTAPAAPNGLTASAVSSTQINISWLDNSTDETSFKIERKTTGEFAQITTVGAGVTTYQNTGLSASTTYYYRVRATNGNGDSAYSNEASATTSGTVTGTIADFPFYTGTLNDQSGHGYTSSLNGNASLGTGGVTLTGGYVSTNVPLSTLAGKSLTIEVLTTCTDPSGYYGALVGASNDYSLFFGKYNGIGQLYHLSGDGLPAGGTGNNSDFVNDSQVHRYVYRVNVPANEWRLYADDRVSTGMLYGGSFVDAGSASNFEIGGGNGANNTFRGVVARVRISDTAVDPANFITMPAVPAAPSGLSATAVSSTQINLAWTDNSNNETGFRIERKTGAGGQYAEIATVGAGVTSYQNTGLTASTAYYYKVRAYNTAGNSGYCTEANATTQAAPSTPTAPSGLAVTAYGSYQINLTWVDNSNNETGFKIERKTGAGGAYAEITTVGAGVTSYQNTGLAAATTYYYKVRAYNAAGNSGYCTEASATTEAAPSAPSAPSGLALTVISSTQINLAWVDNSNNEDGFKIERKPSGGVYAQIDTVGANMTTYQSTGLTASTTYYFKVRAYNAVGNSGYCTEAYAATSAAPATIPTAPSSLTATAAGSTQINLTWTDNSNNEDGFKIERKTGSGGSYLQIASIGAGATTFQNTGLTAGTTYYYRIRAYNTAGDSSFSNEANATTPGTPSGGITITQNQSDASWPETPDIETNFNYGTGGSAISTSSRSAQTFTAPASGDLTLDKLMIRYNTSSATTVILVVQTVSNPNGSSYTAGTNLVTNSTFSLASTSGASKVLTMDLTGTNELSLTASQGYAVDLIATSGSMYWYGRGNSASTYAGGRSYVNYAQRGTAGADNDMGVCLIATPPPAAPSSLTATTVSNSQINLAWTDNASTETGFKIERRTTGSWSQIDTVSSNVTTYSSTSLSAATAYEYRVRAYNAGGDSAYTNTAGATTLPNAPSAPSSLSLTVVGSTQINLSWTDNSSNEDGFKIERKIGAGGTYAQIADVTTTSYQNTGLSASTTYYYKVRAYNTGGDSSYCTEAYATTAASATAPNAPSSLTATAAGSNQINLAWTDNSTNETGFKIERKTGAGGEYTEIDTVGANVTAYYSNSDLVPSTTYYYRVRAYNATGDSAYCDEASATTQSASAGITVTEGLSDTAWPETPDIETNFNYGTGGSAVTTSSRSGQTFTAPASGDLVLDKIMIRYNTSSATNATLVFQTVANANGSSYTSGTNLVTNNTFTLANTSGATKVAKLDLTGTNEVTLTASQGYVVDIIASSGTMWWCGRGSSASTYSGGRSYINYAQRGDYGADNDMGIVLRP